MLPKSIFSSIYRRLATPAAGRVLLVLVLVLLTQLPAFAQTPAQTMTTVKSFAVVFLRGLWAIGLIIGLVKVAKNFLSGSPDSINSLLWLLGGLAIFFGWGYFFRDTLSSTAYGGSTGNIGNSNLNLAISNGAYQMAQTVLNIMLTTVVPLFLFTTIVLTIVRGFLSSGSVQFELGPIFRVIFLYIGLLSYNVLVPQVGNLIGGVATLIKGNTANTSAYTVLNQLKTAADTGVSTPAPGAVTPANAGTAAQDGGSMLSGMSAAITRTFDNLKMSFSPQQFLLGLATSFMTSIIQAIMEFIQSFLLGFLYVAGPIAIAFSFIPGFGGVAKSWLQSLIGIHMWSVAFQVISGLFAYYSANQSLITANAGMLSTTTSIASTQYAVACIVFIVMYVMVPYMSSLIVGSSAADGFVGSAVRVASAAASGGGTAAAGVGKVASGVASSAASAGSAVASAGRAVGGAVSAGSEGAASAASMGGGFREQASGFARGAATSLAPQMMGQAAPVPAARPNAAQGATPQRFTGASQGAASGGSSAGAGVAVNAQSVASSAGANGGSTAPAAPAMNAGEASTGGATVQQAVANSATASVGRSSGANGGSVAANPSFSASGPSIANDPKSPPPSLHGNLPNKRS